LICRKQGRDTFAMVSRLLLFSLNWVMSLKADPF
jgi:hypothetical protein